MSRALSCIALALGLSGLVASPTVAAEFDKYEIESASVSLSTHQAGAHPDFTTALELSEKAGVAYAKTSDIVAELPPGLIGNPAGFPECTTLQLGASPEENECPHDSQVGVLDYTISGAATMTVEGAPVFNMPASNDTVARFGFFAGFYPFILEARLDPATNRIVAGVEGSPSVVELIRSSTTFWGVPGSPAHDFERLTPEEAIEDVVPPGGRPSSLPDVPFMTNPTNCAAGHEVTITAVSYQLPDEPRSKTVPFPQMSGCPALEFSPDTELALSTSQASAASGTAYELDLPTKGLEFAHLNADSHLNRAEVTLPEGMTLNPSAAGGQGVCSQADLARERYDSGPDAGCPETSKLGTVLATSPVIDREARGSLYLAEPYENPADTLIALYLVLKIPDRGVLVKLVGEVSPDPRTGQLRVLFEDIPELPVAHFELRLREGAAAPLITPSRCGTYDAVSDFNPWARPSEATRRSNALQVHSGADRGPCPGPGPLPFGPTYLAGSLSNTAGSYSPFYLRLSRRDGDQDMTKLSVKLPPGMIARLAGTTTCPDAAIAQARSRNAEGGGRLELASPSCPASSEIGRAFGGAGVGQVLTWAEGRLYLAGPYNGAPLSVVSILPAVAGPFDIGNVVTRLALRIDPLTAEVEVDGSASDPIPHILAGIPLKVREIRAYVDKPNFTLNPTSCEPSEAQATLWAGGDDVFSPDDDAPHLLASRFQAAECAALGFKPRLGLTLEGGTKRGGHPALRGVFRPRRGDANLKSLVLRLPRSAFLDQAHIRTICTRAQFAANGGNGRGCPKGSIYGYARAWTPILDEPLRGPVFLRSSNNNLPDFVAALRGLVDVEAVARIDSVRGGIRATFAKVPDAPLTRVVVNMQGGKKGLIVNSRNLCAAEKRSDAAFSAHNGRRAKGRPLVRAKGCGKKKRRGGVRGRGRRR